MKKLRTGLLVFVAVIGLGACSGAIDTNDRPSTSLTTSEETTPSVQDSEQPELYPGKQLTSADPSEATEFDSEKSLSEVQDQASEVAPDVQTLPDGTQMWGTDGCLWTVLQGYWLQTGACAVPDVNDQSIYYLYPFGSDPSLTWYAEVSVDPTLTSNGAYFVYYLPGGTNWVRCHTDCTNIANYEVFVGGQGWLNYSQITSGYQRKVQSTQQQTTTLTVGGQSPAVTQANSSLLQQQGAPAGSSLSMGNWDFFQVINAQIDRTALNGIHASCTYTRRGC